MTSLLEIGEQVFVEALVAQATVEALDEAILHRFAWRDVVPFDAALLLPAGAVLTRQESTARVSEALDLDLLEIDYPAWENARKNCAHLTLTLQCSNVGAWVAFLLGS